MEANGLGPVGLLPREESDLGPYCVQFGPLWTDFTAKEYTSFFLYMLCRSWTHPVFWRRKKNKKNKPFHALMCFDALSYTHDF